MLLSAENTKLEIFVPSICQTFGLNRNHSALSNTSIKILTHGAALNFSPLRSTKWSKYPVHYCLVAHCVVFTESGRWRPVIVSRAETKQFDYQI